MNFTAGKCPDTDPPESLGVQFECKYWQGGHLGWRGEVRWLGPLKNTPFGTNIDFDVVYARSEAGIKGAIERVLRDAQIRADAIRTAEEVKQATMKTWYA